MFDSCPENNAHATRKTFLATAPLPPDAQLHANRCQVTPQAFDALDPDMRMLAAVDIRGFIVTCKAKAGEAADGGRSGTTEARSVFAPHFFRHPSSFS